MTRPSVSLEELFEELLGEPSEVRVSYYRSRGVPDALASLAEELFTAHASADFELPESPSLEELAVSDERSAVGLSLDGRYRLMSVVGGGSFGTVYRGIDQLTHDEVAVKIPLVAPLSRAALEREAACLRRLEFGVARLRDQGVFEGDEGGERHYLVFDFIEGTPFPGTGCPRDAFHSLVRSIAAVHRRGVVHRDLKPENVLVTADDQAFLVDFGIAHGPAFGAARAGPELSVGTEAYAAPEQLDGEMGDAGSDVYSCALMGLRALTGYAPGELRDGAEAVALEPGNESLCRSLLAVIRSSRGDRPRNAQELQGLLARPAAAPDRANFESLVAQAQSNKGGERMGYWVPIFAGLEPIHRLRSGAATELARRCGRDGRAAAQQLKEWVERGVAFWSGDRIEVHAAGLFALRSEPLGSAAGPNAAGVELDAAARTAWVNRVAAEVSELDVDGWSAQASSVLVDSLARVRTWPLGSSAAERRLLPLLVRIAMQDRKLPALDHAAFELARSRMHGVLRDILEQAIQGARSNALGNNQRAAEGVEEVTLPTSEIMRQGGVEDLKEWCRITAYSLSLCYHGSLSLGRTEGRAVRAAVLRRARSIAGDVHQQRPLRASRFRWAALSAYRRGSFERSAALYRASARAMETRYSEASCYLSAASAAMEALHYDLALTDVERARDAIYALPFPTLEARALWTTRSLRFRMGELPEPDVELDASFETLGLMSLSALYGLTEAAIARVRQDSARYRSMSALSFGAFKTLGQFESTALARALVIDAGGEPDDGDAELFGSLVAASDPGVALQVLALAPSARQACQPLLAGWLEAFGASPIAGFTGGRLDVLSCSEIETLLGLAPFGDR